MTKKEWEQREHQNQALASLGITPEDIKALRRISHTLRRWFEKECGDSNGGCIERDGQNGHGKPFWTYDTVLNGNWKRKRYPIPDREAGARKRLDKIMAKYPTLTPYIQGDPRGAALYILRPKDMLEREHIASYYSRGICVY